MKPSAALEQNREDMRQIVARHYAAKAWIFGSVLTGDDRLDRNLDIMIDPTPETTLLDMDVIRNELLLLLRDGQS